MKFIAAIALVLMTAISANAEFKSKEEINSWFTYYYKNPEPSRVPELIEYLSQSGLLDKDSAVPPIFGFLAGGFSKNPDKAAAWVDRLSTIKESHLSVVILGLWYANLPESQKTVYALLEKHPKLKEQFAFLYKGSPMPILSIPLEQGAWVLDALWGNYMATGEKEPVVRIMTALPWADIKGDVNRLLVGGAARWSLTSNAVQHERVLAYCEAEVLKQPEDVATKLREVIARAKEEKSGHNKSPS